MLDAENDHKRQERGILHAIDVWVVGAAWHGRWITPWFIIGLSVATCLLMIPLNRMVGMSSC